MLSDSSNSDTSPIKNKRTSLKIQETSESEDDHESPIVKRKTLIRRRVSSSSDSSGSCIVGPSHKKTKVIPESESESCSSSSDSEVEEVFRPWSTKRPKSRSLLQSDSGSSSEEYSSNGKQSKTKENGDQSSDSDDSEKCIICFKAFRGVIAHPSGCTHNFHSECLLTWSKTSNTCPIDRVKYTEVIVTGIHGEVTRHDVVTPPPQDHNNDIEPDDTTFCEVCNQHDRENEMLLCDRCEAGYHLDCLNPPLEEVPIGDWFCPDCTSLRNDIGDDEVRDLLRGTILIESRLRGRPIVDRPPRIGPRTRAAQRVISSIREMANQNELSQPSVSTSRRTTNKQNRRVNKKRRRKRTHYNVELITTESGATIEVKVAVNTRKRRKKKRRRSCKGHSKAKSTFGKMALSKNLEAANNNNSRRNLNELAVQPLDIFGSRPQLEYFSGCEAEDEFDEEGGGGLGLLRMRSTVIRSMANRKQLAAQVLRSAPRRPIPTVGLATAPPDLISSILNQQEKWHSPNAVIKSNSKGEVKVALHGKSNNIPVKKSVGSEGKTSSTSGTNNQNLSKEGTATPQQSNGESGESVPPLQPPPQPLFSRAYDDEDFDLYADIEAPVEPPLAPPPEPPALLLAMEGDEAASSPEDAMLVIDDRQTYDPDIPTSPPPSPEKPEDNMEIDLPEVTDNRPSMNISSAQIPLPPRIPSPTNEDDIDDCPNRVMYSEASVNIARETKSDSEAEELDVSKSNVPINIIIDTAKNVNQKQNDPDNLSDTDINILDDGENTVVTGDNEDLKDDEYVGEDMIDVSECNITEKKETETCENPNIAAVSECNLDMSDEDCSAETESNSKKLIIGESLLEENSTFESKKHDESDTDDDRDVNIDLEKISEEENISPKEQLDDHQSSSQVNLKDDSPTLSVDEKDKESDDAEIVKVIGSESGDEVERKCQDGWSRESSPSRKVIAEKDEGERKCHDDWSRESSPKRRIIPEKDEGEDVLELGCGDDERDGLVDITDEEISTYEKSWELEDNNAPTKNTVGIEGLETEAISDCEYNIAEDGQPTRANVDNGPKEEGEIITEERKAPVAWKKISKSTKERSYREKEASTFKEKTKKKEKKPKEKRKELERYDVRKIISDKPKKRKVDEFGRDISPSRSRSLSDSRSRSRSVSRRRSRSRSVKKRRSRDRRSRNRSIAKSRGRSRPKSRDKSRKRSRGRSKSRSRSGSKRRRSRSPRKNKERRSRAKSKEKKRRKRESSISCSSCSCSSCEQERRKSKKLTVIVPNKPLAGGSTKEKKKGKYKDRTEGKRRRVDSPVPSKEVFTSGDNILVSVNFKSSKSGETSRKEPSKKKKDEETKKKKDKGSKENQPLRSIVSKSSSNQQGQKKGKINSKNLKPVAIIDLAQSPFREQTLSPKEIIVLTDSDSDDKRKPDENNIPSCQVTGPKTPPEPHIKFNIINSKPQMLRSLVNPLLDSADQLEGDVDDDEDDRVEIPHKGPNTPPEPPVPYDPFEPTKSRSPTPLQELEESRNATPPTEKNLPIDPPQRPITPPKPLPESPKTPSPLHSPPPKPAEESTPEKAHLSPPNDCNDDSMDIGGGDSPYSPGSSEADDLFDAPTAMNTSTPIAKVKPRQIQQKHPQKLSSPLKRKPGSSKLASKNSKANNKKEASKLDEDQLKILDDLPNSAVEMQVKDKFLKKLNRQERVVEEVKMVLKPHYAKKHVTKEEYKDILRKSVPKICHSRSGEINPMKIQRLIEAYVKKYRHLKKKRKPATFSAPESLQPLKPKGMSKILEIVDRSEISL